MLSFLSECDNFFLFWLLSEFWHHEQKLNFIKWHFSSQLKRPPNFSPFPKRDGALFLLWHVLLLKIARMLGEKRESFSETLLLRLKVWAGQGHLPSCGATSVSRKLFCSQTIEVSCTNQGHRQPRNAAVLLKHLSWDTYPPQPWIIRWTDPRAAIHSPFFFCPASSRVGLPCTSFSHA